APHAASSIAVARPRPDPPPLTTITWPSSRPGANIREGMAAPGYRARDGRPRGTEARPVTASGRAGGRGRPPAPAPMRGGDLARRLASPSRRPAHEAARARIPGVAQRLGADPARGVPGRAPGVRTVPDRHRPRPLGGRGPEGKPREAR